LNATHQPVALSRWKGFDMTNSIQHWNKLSLAAAKADCSSTDPQAPPEQAGPTRASRALAIVQLAMHDAHAGIVGGPMYLTYAPGQAPGTNDLQAAQAAVSVAACRTLTTFYSRQRNALLLAHETFMRNFSAHDPHIALGLAWGEWVADEMLAACADDGWCGLATICALRHAAGRDRVAARDREQGFLGALQGKLLLFRIKQLTSAIGSIGPSAREAAQYAEHYKRGGVCSTTETTIGQHDRLSAVGRKQDEFHL
jgi:Vanadium chloroperoxidase N-terminal domain